MKKSPQSHKNEVFTIKNKVQIFPQKGGWYYIKVPLQYTQHIRHLADRGLVAITATVGESSWPTSLLPLGDGSHFIALPAKIRTKENIALDDTLQVTFSLRKR